MITYPSVVDVSLPRAPRQTSSVFLAAFLGSVAQLVGWLSGATLTGALVALVIITVGIVVHARSLTLGLLSPFGLWFLGLILYTLPVAMTLQLVGFLPDFRELSTSGMANASALSALAIVAGLWGYGLRMASGRHVSRLTGAPRPSRISKSYLAASASALVVVGLLLLTMLLWSVGGIGALRGASYATRYLLLEGLGPLLFGLQFITSGALVLYALELDRGTKTPPIAGLLLVAFLVAWMLLTGSRSALVNGLVGLAAVRTISGKPIPARIAVILAPLVLIAGIIYGRVGRSDDQFNLADQITIEALNPAASDFGAPVGTTADILRSVPVEEPFRLGITYFYTVPLLVPHALWPNRTRSLSQWYVERFYPALAEQGGGMAFSPVAEAYLNFGVAGVVGVFLVFGMFCAQFQLFLDRGGVASIARRVAYGSVAGWLLIFSRSDFAAYVKLGLVAMLLPLAIALLASGFLRLALYRRPLVTTE